MLRLVSRGLLVLALSVPVLVLLAASASAIPAIPMTFSCITNNAAGNCSTGSLQLGVEVSDLGANQMLFEFSNAGPLASSIADVYFDGGTVSTLLGIAGLIDADDDELGSFGSAGVDFSVGASPPNLPGGNTVGFVTTAGLLADSDPPVQPNGVNPGEMLGVVVDLRTPGTFADVIAELTDGRLRIGMHVQGFSDGGSESFVNNQLSKVPEPGTALLMGLGLLGLAKVRRHV